LHHLNKIIHVAKASGLPTIAIDGDVLSSKGLNDKVTHHATIVRMHARAVGIKNSDDLYLQLMLPPVIKKEGLSTSFSLVVTRTNANRVDLAPVTLGLGMNLRVPVDLARRGLKNSGSRALSQTQHIDRAMHTRLGGLHGVMLVMNGARRAGEIEDLINLHVEREGDVVSHQFEVGPPQKVGNVSLTAREKVVHAEHLVTRLNQTIAEVRP